MCSSNTPMPGIIDTADLFSSRQTLWHQVPPLFLFSGISVAGRQEELIKCWQWLRSSETPISPAKHSSGSHPRPQTEHINLKVERIHLVLRTSCYWSWEAFIEAQYKKFSNSIIHSIWTKTKRRKLLGHLY